MRKRYSTIVVASALIAMSACTPSTTTSNESTTDSAAVAASDSAKASADTVNETVKETPVANANPSFAFALSNENGSKLLVMKKPVGGNEFTVANPEDFTYALVETGKGSNIFKIKYEKYQNANSKDENLRDNSNHFDNIEGWLYNNEEGKAGSDIASTAFLYNDAFGNKYEISSNLTKKNLSAENSAMLEKQFGKKIHEGTQVDLVLNKDGVVSGTFIHAIFEPENGEVQTIHAWIYPDNTMAVNVMKDPVEGMSEEELEEFYEMNSVNNGAGGIQSVCINKEDAKDIFLNCWDATEETVNNYIYTAYNGQLARMKTELSRYTIE